MVKSHSNQGTMPYQTTKREQAVLVVLRNTSGQGILRSSRAVTVKKCTKKIAVREILPFYLL